MKNLDIKNFALLSGVSIGDYFLMVTESDTDGKLSARHLVLYMQDIAKPQISELTGNWMFKSIDGDYIDTGVKATAQTPVFHKQSGAIVWKYADEADTEYRTLVEIADLKFNPSDLTEEEWSKIKLNYADLTEDDKNDLRSVFLGVVNRAEQAAIGYENAKNEIYKSITSAAEANDKALKAQQAAESAQKVAEDQRDQTIDYLNEVKGNEEERVRSEEARKQQETARVNAEKKRTDDWQAWFEAETSGVKALWAAWYTQTQNAFNGWFGATENEGVRKSVSDWLAEVQRLWTAFYGADSNSGVRGNWAAWLQSVTNDWSDKLTSVDNDWSSAKDAINSQWAALMKVINDNWAEKQSTIDTEWSDKKTEITNAWNTWFGTDETLGIRGEYKAWYDALVADWDKWYGDTKEGYATWLADSKKEWNDTKAEYDKEWNDAKARYDKEWSGIKTDVSNEWAEQKKAIDDAWNAWYGTSSDTGIQGVWGTWFNETTLTFNNWFGATESEGVRGDWDSWLAKTMMDWNDLSSSVNNAADNANAAADNANDAASHAPYIGEDKYWYIWNNTTKTYDKTSYFSQGKGFHIKKLFASIAEMEAYVNPSTAEGDDSILTIGDYVSIVSDVEDVDNAKLFIVESVTDTKITYGYQGDMSGARGFTGHTPQLSIGTITTGAEGSSASVSLSENGTDTEGNPKYLINFAIPKGDKGDKGDNGDNGDKGDKGDPFTYDDFTPEQIAELQKPATDAIQAANDAAAKANDAAKKVEEAIGTIKLNWGNIEDKPTTVAGYGITDLSISDGIITIGANSITPLTAESSVAWSKLTGVPSSFTPSSHTHAIGDITNLQTTLDGKAAASHTHAIANITNISSASVSYASSAGNADTCDGLHVHGGRNYEANKIVRTDGSGYIQCGYINSSSGNEGNNSSPARVWGTNGSDNYMRTYLTSALSVKYASSAGNADTLDGNHASAFASASHSHSYIPTSASCNKNWSWSGQGGQPSWLWGSNDGSNCYVWNPSNFRVSYASSAGNADTLDGYHYNSFAWASHSHSYLPLSGGTMSGAVKIQLGNTSEPLYLMGTNSANSVSIGFGYNNGNGWSMGMSLNDSYAFRWYNNLQNKFAAKLWCSGSLDIGGSLSQSSDMRLKQVISDVELTTKSIADAPLFQFQYLQDFGNMHIGTSAQYWNIRYNGYFTRMDDNGYLSIEYTNLGVAMGISIARHVKAYESKTDKRLDELERENKELKERLAALEAA